MDDYVPAITFINQILVLSCLQINDIWVVDKEQVDLMRKQQTENESYFSHPVFF